MRRLLGVIGFCAALLAGGGLLAEPFPDYRDLYINDYSDVLPPESEDRLRGYLDRLKTETGVEMTVLTIPTRRAFDATDSIEDFATGLFNAWGIGNAERNDGILVLVATEDREMRLELGAGYNQGYDVLAQDMVNRYFLPEFRNGNYAAGIEAGTVETIARIARRNAEGLEAEKVAGGGGIVTWLTFGLMGLIGGLIVFGRKIADLIAGMKPCPQCGQRHLSRTHETLQFGTETLGGMRRTTTTCRTCGYRDQRDTPITRSRSSSSGGSFGGGKSSGGGATGRW
ncbi:MAG: hypothetical protein RLZZ528_922 [Pseudomonadota bacterium]|jgi:uncharacterized protein